MKHKKTILVLVFLINAATVGTSQATLFDRGGGMIYDDVLNVTWLQNANLFKAQADSNPNLINEIIAGNSGGIANHTIGIYNPYDQWTTYSSHPLSEADFNTSTGAMTWWGATAWANNLTVGGYDDWKLPTVTPSSGGVGSSQLRHLILNELGSQEGYDATITHNSNYNLFSNIQSSSYWTDYELGGISSQAYKFIITAGFDHIYDFKSTQFYAWAVRPGDVVPVPTLNAVSPAYGVTTGGTLVTLTGSSFTGATAVSFGGIAATNITVVSDTSLSATTPAHAAGDVSVLVTTSRGTNPVNSIYRYTDCGAGVPLTTGTAGVGALWQMLSLPCVPTSNTIAGVFGTGTPSNLSTATYASTTPTTAPYGWLIEKRTGGATPAYEPLLTSDLALSVGIGYWIKSFQIPTNGILTMIGTATPTDVTQAQGCASVNGCKAITVTTVTGANRYNLVGNPFAFSVDWSKVRIRVDGSVSTLTPSAANTAGYVSNVVNIWNSTSYTSFNDINPTKGNLQYFKSFWVNVLPAAFGHTIELLIPAEDANGGSYTYNIGSTGPAGGKVFYITDGGLHGMEAAPVDQSGGIKWGCYWTTVGTTSAAVGTGNANTVAINALCGTETAAQVAASYSLNGYSDWYLPSKDELNLLYRQRNIVGGFNNKYYYWSSTEKDSGDAWNQAFSNRNTTQGYSAKNQTDFLSVRAVRTF